MGGKTCEDEPNLETPSISSFVLNLLGAGSLLQQHLTTEKCWYIAPFLTQVEGAHPKIGEFLVSMLKQLLEKIENKMYMILLHSLISIKNDCLNKILDMQIQPTYQK